MEYWKMNTEKVNEFNSLNEEVDEFTSRWTHSSVNVRTSS